jgi:HD-like signal output (HDOD) protein
LRSRILKRLGSIDDLPAYPEIVTRLERELACERTSARRVAAIVEEDAVLAARFLRLANSAMYSVGTPTASIQQAVARVGLAEARRITVATAVLRRFAKFGGSHPRRFWLHSIAVGLASRVIARMATPPATSAVIDATFTAGLLHDLGVLVFMHAFPSEYQEITNTIEAEGGIAVDVERQKWGIEHGEVGALFAHRWRLPSPLCDVIHHHHSPWAAPPDHRRLVQFVHLGNFVCNNQGLARHEEGFPQSFDHGAWNTTGLRIEDVTEIIERVRKEGERSASFVELAA